MYQFLKTNDHSGQNGRAVICERASCIFQLANFVTVQIFFDGGSAIDYFSGKPDDMIQVKQNNSGTVAVTLILLLIITLAVLSIARHFWSDSANEHFDKLISVYIMEKEDLNPDDQDRLKAQLLEDGMFFKMHRWNKESFIKDRQLYDEMIITRDRRQMREEEAGSSVIETMINL